MDQSFRFYRAWIMVSSVFFGCLALSWVVLGSFDVLGVWDGYLANWMFDGDTPDEVVQFRKFILAPFGASVAGFYLLNFLVAKHGLRPDNGWALAAIAAGVNLWFWVDSIACFVKGAYFNILLVNLPCYIMSMIPIVALYFSYFSRRHD